MKGNGSANRLTVYIPNDLRERLDRCAYDRRESLSKIVVAALRKHLAEEQAAGECPIDGAVEG